MHTIFLFFIFLFNSFVLFGWDELDDFYEETMVNDERVEAKKRGDVLNEYPYNPHVPIDLWMELKPYFLPMDHPIKKKLDRLFEKKRVTLSNETFVAAGFSITRPHRPFNAMVTGHKKLKGYLLKIYLDSQFNLPEWEMWMRRIKGAAVVRECLIKHRFTQFVVPKKWIYPLPAEPSPPLGDLYHRKNFILVVEDMDILDRKKNEQAYKQNVTRSLLKALYTVLVECQLTDCVYIGNMPFTKSGKIAFIDIELFHNGAPEFHRLKKYFSLPMQNHLDKLVREGESQ